MSASSSLAFRLLCHAKNVGLVLRKQSRLKIAFTLAFAACFEAGLFWMFFDGFRFLNRMGGVGLIIINKLFSVFFLGMGLMLVISSIVSSYATIYRSEEIPFLITRPFRNSQIVLYKFFESAILSSWAFFFIIIPFVGAYALHERISPAFALWTLLFSIPFLTLCSGLGTIITMIFARWTPLGRILRIAGILALALITVSILVFIHSYRALPMQSEMNLASLLPGLNLASNPLLPSWWMSEGIAGLTRNEWFRGMMFLGMTLSSAMLLCIAIEWLAGRIFYEGWQRMTGAPANKNRSPLMLAGLQGLLSFAPNDARAIFIKDIRTFLRDPMQWSQALIFFGLLAIYFANLRTFKYHILPDNWRNTIAFLNVFSVSAVVCSLGSRFIYPQLSMEGQGFWILGLSPAKMSRILMTKFTASVAGMTIISVTLMTLSSWMLNAAPVVRAVGFTLACSISFAVCGLSTGLGAIYLDLNQRNPSAIVSGYGGTLNLVLCLGFMLAAIMPFGLIFHSQLLHHISPHQAYTGLLFAGIWLVVLTAAGVIIPLRLGLKSLLSREF